MKEINFEVFEALSLDNASIFVSKYKAAAKEIERQTGLSYIAVLVQAALESGWGLKVVGNNFFGIKWMGKGEKQLVTTTEILWSPNEKFPEVLSMTKRPDGKYVYKVKDYFRKYDTPEQSFQDHALFFQENKRYAKAWGVRGITIAFFEEIAKAGYATADNYADYLKSVAKSVIKTLMRVIVLLIVLLGLAAQSCGSRKVEKHSKSSLEESKTSLQEQTKVTEIQFDRKKVFEIMRELNIRNGSITFNPDGSVTAKGDEIDLRNKEIGEELESVGVKEKNTDLYIDQGIINKDNQNDVKIDRKQFNWWGVIIPLGILIFVVLLVIYFFRKKWKNF